jgi:transcriptional regulator with XRE-family HTH domain
LIIEKASDDQLWGRVSVDDNLITDEAASLPALLRKMKKLLNDFHDIKPLTYDFDLTYDLTALFNEKKYLNLSEVASQAGINRSLMAQYAAGTKFPSVERAKEIEEVIHELGRELMKVKLAVKGRSLKTAKKASTPKKTRQKAKV